MIVQYSLSYYLCFGLFQLPTHSLAAKISTMVTSQSLTLLSAVWCRECTVVNIAKEGLKTSLEQRKTAGLGDISLWILHYKEHLSHYT